MKTKNLLTAFDKILGPKLEPQPEGYFTVEQIAEHRKISPPAMAVQLTKLAKEKKVQRIKGRSQSGRPCWFYRVK